MSDLADSILLYILSFIPTKLAATTTILSKRYKFLYLQLFNLHFDDQAFQHFNSFINFISKTITSRDTTLPIHSFTFKSSSYNSKRLNHLHCLTCIMVIFTDVFLEENLMWLLELLEHCSKLQNFIIQV